MLHHGDERSGCEAIIERVGGAIPGEACELLVCAMDAKYRIGALLVVHSGWECTTSIRLTVEAFGQQKISSKLRYRGLAELERSGRVSDRVYVVAFIYIALGLVLVCVQTGCEKPGCD